MQWKQSLHTEDNFDLTLTLMIQDSGPSRHRTMFRFSKLKLIGLGGLGMVPVRPLLWRKLELASVVWGWCQSDHYCDENWNWPRWSGMVPNRSLMSQFKLGILGHTLKEVLPSACPVFSWRSLPMLLLPHCPGGCSRGSPLCLQSSCPAHWDGALVSEVSGSYLWWISSRSGQRASSISMLGNRRRKLAWRLGLDYK